jgi:uncharacterized tellurite resistance protein B-like protein
MLEKLRTLLAAPPSPTEDTVGWPYRRRDIAVVALMIELAQVDRAMSDDEARTIERIVRARFGLDGREAAGLIAAARTELDAALEDWVFANAVRTGFDFAARADIVGLLFEIVYADGRFARLERMLVERLSEALGVDEPTIAQARAEAYARLQSDAPGNGADSE